MGNTPRISPVWPPAFLQIPPDPSKYSLDPHRSHCTVQQVRPDSGGSDRWTDEARLLRWCGECRFPRGASRETDADPVRSFIPRGGAPGGAGREGERVGRGGERVGQGGERVGWGGERVGQGRVGL